VRHQTLKVSQVERLDICGQKLTDLVLTTRRLCGRTVLPGGTAAGQQYPEQNQCDFPHDRITSPSTSFKV
jgi:hypothetical protein